MATTADLSADLQTAGGVAVGATASSTFEQARDTDWFRVHLDAGVTYNFTMYGAASGMGTLQGDPEYGVAMLTVYDTAGQRASPWGGVTGAAGHLPALPFTPSASGDYFVSAQGALEATYTLGVATGTRDDVGDTAPGARALAIGASASGAIAAVNDHDWFKVRLEAGKLYSAVLRDQGDGAAGQLDLLLRDGQGNPVDVAQTPGPQSNSYALSGTPFASGDYYLDVSSWLGTGAYQLSVALVTDDYSADSATIGRLTVGASASGNIEAPNDRDWFRVALAENQPYVFDLGGGAGAALALIGPDGARRDIASGALVYANAAGDYHVEVQGPAGAYTLSVNPLRDDYTDNPGQGAGTLTAGASLAARFDYIGDADAFRMAVQAGHTYRVAFSTDSAAGQSRYDLGATLSALDATSLQTPGGLSGQGSTEAAITFKALGDGEVALTARNSGAPQGYRVTATDVGTDDAGDDAAHAAALAAGASVSAVLDRPSDIDVFALALQAGVSYEVRAGGELAGLNALLVAPIASASWGGGGHASYLVTPTAGTANHAYVRGFQSAGAYTLQALAVTDDYSANAATTGRLAPGGGASGVLRSYDDRDWFAISLEAGKSYRIELDAARPVNRDMLLSLLDAGGNELATGNYYSGMRLTYTAQASGTYYAQLAGTAGRGAGSETWSWTADYADGGYTLRATDLTPDVTAPRALSMSDAVAAVGGEIVVRFSETVARGGGSMEVRDQGGNTVLSVPADSQAVGLSGDTLTLKLSTALLPGASYSVALSSGFVTDAARNALAGDLRFTVNAAAAATAPGAGADVYAGRGDGSVIDGGAGLDSVVYGDGVTIGVVAGRHTATPSAAGARADTLAGIERVFIAGGSDAIALDVDGVGGRAYRLYQSAFDRTPDSAGVGYWMAAMERGASLLQVARGFVASEEFRGLYGHNPGDADFVGRLYQNVLHRPGEQAGVDYWTGVLRQGADRAEVLAAFSEGAENKSAVAALIANGFHYTPYG
ncbi:DUF4214 domain-containing protein [Pseudoduganella namucuonensis]|uniref:Pre-peptidase C-terminal domain-containing protein n=1 Tax=Pseudoduganella namucuonensis TaxID=1035707 RepID=A0A1I7KC22_9BURK|nr:DUF4214 domain-containing protein [Pseudoduganella namucuonensis]SFU94955.1 pre-peptidase C-terminal domain-containing protein [Pseudoduganella namucuonensis]